MSAPAPQLPSGSPEPENEVRLSFLEHLRELRVRLGRALLGVAVGMAALGAFVVPIDNWLMAPVLASLPEGHQNRIFSNPVEPLLHYMKVAMYGGIFAAAPWVLYQFWLFIAPGLYKREKRIVFPFLFSGTLLFYAGAAFCYLVIMPPAFPAMLSIAEGTDMVPMLNITELRGLVLAMLLGFGLVFEMPVVIAFLAMIGLVSAQGLAKYRRYAVIVNVIAAAILTPTGDPLNLAMMALPMIVFYEIGIILARLLGKKKVPDAGVAEA